MEPWAVMGASAATGRVGLAEKREQAPALQRRLLIGGGQGLVGGSEEWGGFIEDDGDGDIAEEAFEFPFVLEGMKESAVFHFFEDLNGDATGNVNAAERKNFQRKISGFGAIDSGPKIQRVRADAARLVQPAAGDFRGRIGVGVFKRGVYNLRCEKLVEGAEAATGENEFPAYLRIAAAHEAQQFNLLLGMRREIRVPAFGWHNAIAAAIPHKNRLAKAGTCRN